MRLAARKGFTKAAVATARKIAIVTLRVWRDGRPLPGTKRRCRHDRLEIPESVPPERNAVPPGRRQGDLAIDVEAGHGH